MKNYNNMETGYINEGESFFANFVWRILFIFPS